jgi:hypothetical protein
MHSCTVNGSKYEAQRGLKTWGELLDALERGDGPARAIVTAVRFGGVDQPSFRDPSVLARDLRFAAPVDVDVCAARELITSAVETALEGLQPISDAARGTADLFRQHELPAAHAALAELVSALQTLASLTAAVTTADRQSGAVALDPNNVQRAQFLDRVGRSLESLITAAAGEDWISVADVLEYEIAEELPRWQDVLHTIGLANAAPGLASDELSNLRLRYAS